MTEEERNAHLAHILGISAETLSRLHHSGLKEVTDSELQVYKYYIEFGSDSAPDILDIINADEQRRVYFPASVWENEKEH